MSSQGQGQHSHSGCPSSHKICTHVQARKGPISERGSEHGAPPLSEKLSAIDTCQQREICSTQWSLTVYVNHLRADPIPRSSWPCFCGGRGFHFILFCLNLLILVLIFIFFCFVLFSCCPEREPEHKGRWVGR